MALNPRYRYSSMIFAEIMSSIGASLVDAMGSTVAFGVFSQVSGSVGGRDAKELASLLGVKPGNAASACVMGYTTGRTLDIKIRCTFDPYKSDEIGYECLYGSAIHRYKKPLVCALCNEYDRGIALSMGVKFHPSEQKMSMGAPSCPCYFYCENPTHLKLPNKWRVELVIAITKLLADKNMLVVSCISSIINGLADRAEQILGPHACLIPARGTYAGGVYHGPIFSNMLGLKGGVKDSALLIANVRDTVGCKVKTEVRGDGFSIVTKKCPHAVCCHNGSFMETACIYYARGLLSQWGDFEVKCDVQPGVCRQDFSLRSAPVVKAV